jgi:negative regulator of sigma E activity
MPNTAARRSAGCAKRWDFGGDGGSRIAVREDYSRMADRVGIAAMVSLSVMVGS